MSDPTAEDIAKGITGLMKDVPDDASPPPTTKLAHSYSSLKQFENCPKQYHMVKITKEVTTSWGEASIYGTRIHTSLERRLRDNTPLDAESARYEPLCAAFQAMSGEMGLELELTLDNNLQPTGWWDDNAWFRCKLDVTITAGSCMIYADWKTGKRRPDIFQLEVAVMMIFVHFPKIERVKAGFIWLKDMVMDFPGDYTRKDFARIRDKIQQRITLIENAERQNKWPAKPSGLCPWCPAKNICEFAQLR